MEQTTVQVFLPLLMWKEEMQFVAFTPALDLSSSGDSEKEALANFSEAVELFVETALERNLLREILESLGWRLESNKWIPASEPMQASQSFSVNIPVPSAIN